MQKFKNAQSAFEFFYAYICADGLRKSDTLYMHNIGFYITDPCDNEIHTPWRKWSKAYADREWNWYLSKNRSVADIKKHARIWDCMHGGDDIVNSNYGWQWHRNDQLSHAISLLEQNAETRRASITVYDGKEHDSYKFDTPCTLNITFNITAGALNMTVMMRSNDLWFGFCNDQYCFSKLQMEIAAILNLKLGWYYHFVNDFHLYLNKIHLKK